jgi:hypothetical protein
MKTCERTGKPIVELSHSGLMTFNSCPKKFAFRKMIVNFENEREESNATAVGTAMHEGLQEFMRTRSLEKALIALALAHPVQLDESNGKAWEYSLEASITTLEYVVTQSELARFELVYFKRDGVEIPATEIAYMIEIETKHLVFQYRMLVDTIARNPDTGLFLPIDYKTTTEKSAPDFHVKYKWDNQVTSYGIALQHLLGYDGQFETGVLGIIMSDRKPSTVFPIFQRGKADIDDFYYTLLDNCRRIEQYYVDDRFPRGPAACISYKRPCPFLGSCGVTGLQQMQMLMNPSKKTGAGHPSKHDLSPMFTVRLEGM